MIDIQAVTRFDRTKAELEEFALFATLVANRGAARSAVILEAVLSQLRREIRQRDQRRPSSPFAVIRARYQSDEAAKLGLRLQNLGQGCHGLKARGILALAYTRLDLRMVTCDRLETLPGWGPKTARFFLLHSRRNAGVAALDVHILRKMREWGIDAPRQTPPAGRKYAELEQAFLAKAAELGRDPAEFDLEIWRAGSAGRLHT